MNEHVLCIPRDDVEDASIVVNITAHGSLPLDVTLLATESEFPYVAKLEQSRASKLRNKAGPTDKQQWQEILTKALLQDKRDEPVSDKTTHDSIQLAANIAGNRLSIVLRRNIEGIVQRLGEITLNKDVEQEIELFDWVQVAVKRSDGLEAKIQVLQSKFDEQNRQMQKVNHQLEEFIQAKQEHETDLLEKFQRLLNEKKLKIRDQQRLLNSSSVVHSKSSETDNVPQRPTRASPTEPRAGKRKAKAQVVKSESDSDGDFERMGQQDQQMDSGQQTPEADRQSETESDGSDDDPNLPQRPVSTKNIQPDGALDSNSRVSPATKTSQDPPPFRDLPFLKQSTLAPQPPTIGNSGTSMVDEGETTDDDEL